jgi:hypothetical protein
MKSDMKVKMNSDFCIGMLGCKAACTAIVATIITVKSSDSRDRCPLFAKQFFTK